MLLAAVKSRPTTPIGCQDSVNPLDSLSYSTAFFPKPDGVERAAAAGVRAIVQPGGSIGDEAVIAAADQPGMAMVFTGVRHFQH